jgi:hypothetical protein
MPVDLLNIRYHQGKPVPVGAMPQKPSGSGAVHRRVRGFSMPPHIRGPDLEAPAAEPPGKFPVPQAMFRHTVNDMHHPPGPAFGFPLPYKKLISIRPGYPIIQFIHDFIVLPMLMF